jgi:hypothetical protein
VALDPKTGTIRLIDVKTAHCWTNKDGSQSTSYHSNCLPLQRQLGVELVSVHPQTEECLWMTPASLKD